MRYYTTILCFVTLFVLTTATESVFASPLQDNAKETTTTTIEPSAELKAAIALGEIEVALKPMIPSESETGLPWSPSGTKVQLAESDGRLTGGFEIGEHKIGGLQLTLPEKPDGKATLEIDNNGDGSFGADEKLEFAGSLIRGKYWYSFNAQVQLPFNESTKRDFPITLWYVTDPESEEVETVLRWSRRGWHEGTFKFGEKTCVAIVSDADADGDFSSSDAWGVGLDVAAAREDSSNGIDTHSWMDGIAYQVTEVDPNGKSMKFRAFDLGMTEAEDRERKDPYSADRKHARAEKPVPFATDLDEALAIAKRDDKKVVIDFVTTWCGPCRTMDKLVYTAKPMVECSKDYVFVKLDGDEEKHLVEKYGVSGYPTIILADKEGVAIRKVVGYQGVAAMQKLLKDN